MTGRTTPTLQMASRYLALFVNRGAFTVQTDRPNAKGKHYYFRPSPQWFDRRGWPAAERRLCPETIQRHLSGEITVALYAINPQTQRCKWIAIDADYAGAFKDLLKFQWHLKVDDVQSALERSRRGAHLWMFAEAPLLAAHCRLYVYNCARRLGIPIKVDGKSEGIEVFPRQDQLGADEFGNAIRGPLGIHRGAKGKRFWFYCAPPAVDAQLSYLEGLPKITETRMNALAQGLVMPEDLRPRPVLVLPPYRPGRVEFCILDHVPKGRRSGKDYRTRCPSCAQAGRDENGDNLAVSVSDPRKYRCWAGCTKEEIRASVGCPIKHDGEERWQTTARA